MDTLVNEAQLKAKLQPYKKITPFLLDLFIWRLEFYPFVITGIITTFFFLIYYCEPSLITLISVILLVLTVIDFIVPFLSGKLASGDGQSQDAASASLSDEQEKKFAIFVNRICYYSVLIWNGSVAVEEWKRTYPNWYSIILITILLFTAWIGSSINNLFLTYLIVLGLGLLPGLLYRRLPQTYFGKIMALIADMLGKGGKKKE